MREDAEGRRVVEFDEFPLDRPEQRGVDAAVEVQIHLDA